MKKTRKTRKKAAVMVEFLVSLPAFMLLIWGIMQIMLLTISTSTAHEAAVSGARMLTENLRGYDKDDWSGLSATDKTTLETNFGKSVQEAAKFNGFVLLFRDDYGVPKDNAATVKLTTESDCASQISSGIKVVCAYIKSNGADNKEIIVKIKAKFKVIGSFIPAITNNSHVYGNAASQMELTDRFQYFTN